MRKKTFVISIPMLPAENLKLLEYQNHIPNAESCKTRFPGIALIKENMFGRVENKIITVRTEDDNGRTETCYALFKEELAALAAQTGVALSIDKEIQISHSETDEKGKGLLRELFQSYPEKSHVYMDLTYGTKLTAIEMFMSLCYAEIAKKCNIKSVIYGKYSFDNSEHGELFDVTELYHTMRFMETASQMNAECFQNFMMDIVE